LSRIASSSARRRLAPSGVSARQAARIVIETSWGWGEAVVQGLVTPDQVEVGKADGRVFNYQVATKKVVSNFDYAVGRVVETAIRPGWSIAGCSTTSRSPPWSTPCWPWNGFTVTRWTWNRCSTGTAARASRSAWCKPGR
jgi:hypothetical protein